MESVSPLRRQAHTLVRRMFHQRQFGQFLQHRGHGSGRDIHVLGNVARAHHFEFFLQAINAFRVLFDGFFFFLPLPVARRRPTTRRNPQQHFSGFFFRFLNRHDVLPYTKYDSVLSLNWKSFAEHFSGFLYCIIKLRFESMLLRTQSKNNFSLP